MPKYPSGFRPPTQAEKKRQRDKLYKEHLKKLKEIGAYDPKSSKLTRYRKHQINLLWQQFAGFFTRPGQFIVAKFTRYGKKSQKRIIELAQKADVPFITKKAVIVEADGFTKAELKFDKKDDEFGIKMTGKVRAGENKGKVYTRYVPLAGIEEVTKSKERLLAQARRLGPLSGDQHYVFSVVQHGQVYGRSHNSFETPELLIENVMRYHRTLPQNIAFMRMIHIEKHDPKEWFRDNPPKRKKRRTKRQRIIGRD